MTSPRSSDALEVWLAFLAERTLKPDPTVNPWGRKRTREHVAGLSPAARKKREQETEHGSD
jgi:hypothetical protein